MPNLSTKMDELTLLEISIYSRINNILSHMHKRTQELACECVMFEGQCSDWASACLSFYGPPCSSPGETLTSTMR